MVLRFHYYCNNIHFSAIQLFTYEECIAAAEIYVNHTVEEIIQRLETAHKIIQENILNPKLVLIPYKKGSRDYTPEEHLDIVNGHNKEHLSGIRKANKGAH